MNPTAPISSNTSGRLMRKGVLVEETYRFFACWDLDFSVRDNLNRLREDNPIGATNAAWLREVAATLSNRFSNGPSIAPLVILAKGELPLDTWKFCLLWHLHGTDGLFSAFLSRYMLPQTEAGTIVHSTDDVVPFVRELQAEEAFESPLSDYGILRMGRDLLRAAADFGLLEGKLRREYQHPSLPENAILYAIYSLWELSHSTDRMIHSDQWHQFLMRPQQVEHELLNLHQFHRLRYERAGTIRELNLPHESLVGFCKSLVP